MADEYEPKTSHLLPDLFQRNLIVGVRHESGIKIYAIPSATLGEYEVLPQPDLVEDFYDQLKEMADPEEAVAVLRSTWIAGNAG